MRFRFFAIKLHFLSSVIAVCAMGSMIGGMIQGVLANGMNLSSVGIDTQMTIKGLVLLLAVAFDVWSKNRK